MIDIIVSRLYNLTTGEFVVSALAFWVISVVVITLSYRGK